MRGGVLFEANGVLASVRNLYTFRGKVLGSIVDVRYMSAAVVKRVAWQVNEEYTKSDH